jgi:hypothetical protein
VIDGDTLRLTDGRVIRLLNVNAPEKNSNLSELSMLFMKSFENKSLEFEIIGQDKYNRYLSRVYAPYYLNLELIRQGMASKFLVDESELTIFSKAEDFAISNGKGIWVKSVYYGCFSTEIDYTHEKVKLINICDESINLNNWQLKDESRKIFDFPDISVGSIIIYSGIGNNNSTALYWNLKESVWNNDRDTLYLFDNNEKLVYHKQYGY